jgi:hypothetical protein
MKPYAIFQGRSGVAVPWGFVMPQGAIGLRCKRAAHCRLVPSPTLACSEFVKARCPTRNANGTYASLISSGPCGQIQHAIL